MMEWIWIVPALPLAGFLALTLGGRRLANAVAAWIGVGAVAASFAAAAALAASYFAAPPPAGAALWSAGPWIEAGSLRTEFALRLDALSLVMILMVTGVGALILLYSSAYMRGEEGYRRFFAYVNLFVGCMLTLVLADDLLLLYLGWEGVGLCSYLLIGFWHRDSANVLAARKAFVVTRVGDTAFAVGLFFLVSRFGTLSIGAVLERAPAELPAGSGAAMAAAALLLGGALGKSAQVPLQVWLPDAMAGPTPVSALIHAATMVAAGVYLIARLHALLVLAPAVHELVALVGAATLLLAAFAALAQRDLKRTLAYSTMSQIGYMFLALGVGAWSAAIFHFVTHAFFKALLFLGAGVVIAALDGEHDMLRMGGLRRRLPVVFWTFLVGTAALAALPLVTAGFYSKELILQAAWLSPLGGPALWSAAFAGAVLTSLYAFRMLFLVFGGPGRSETAEAARRTDWRMAVPLVALAALSVAAMALQLPGKPHDAAGISHFLVPALPPLPAETASARAARNLVIAAGEASVIGLILAWLLYSRRPARRESAPGPLVRLWEQGWGFDALYQAVLVRPFVRFARVNRNDALDWLGESLSLLCTQAYHALRRTQTGQVWWYAAGVAAGAALAVAIMVFS